VLLELVLVLLLALVQKALSLQRALLRQQLGQRINVVILEKALLLSLRQFEDSEVYDQMTRARREASVRPLSLVSQTFELLQQTLTLLGLASLLLTFSPWLFLALIVAAIPLFVAELSFSTEAWKLSRWRTPEAREQLYLETVIAREDHAKEVKLFELGPRLLDRYKAIFDRTYPGERSLAIGRALWGFALGLLGTAAFYGTYSTAYRIGTTRGSGGGSRAGESCRSGSGRRSLWRGLSCEKKPTCSCSTSLRRRWTQRSKCGSSSAFARAPIARSPS
jgi:ATP-binding cassette subfamily B protein